MNPKIVPPFSFFNEKRKREIFIIFIHTLTRQRKSTQFEIMSNLIKLAKYSAIKINNSKIINGDYVICNSDPPNVYNNLIKSKRDYNFLFKLIILSSNYKILFFSNRSNFVNGI